MDNFVLVVVGPTASGKTSLSVELAKKFDGEVVSADSMQIYQGMDIATAKPTAEEMQGIPHHIMDFLPQNQAFSVAKYKEKAVSVIDDIISRGKLPIICGGTGFYVDTILQDTEFFDYESNDMRRALQKRVEEEGIESLYDELMAVDEEAAKKLSLSDVRRIVRALEIYYSTGKTKTQQNDASHLNGVRYNFCIIGLNAENRQYLYDRINHRVDMMMEAGLLEEARNFFASDVSATAKQAIGYKELKPYFDGISTLEECIEKLKMETRRYAKRQLTWFRKNQEINWLYIDKTEDLVASAESIIKAAMQN